MNSWIFILLISCLCKNNRGCDNWNAGCGCNNSCNNCIDDAKDGCGIPEAWRRTEDCECKHNDWEKDIDCGCKNKDSGRDTACKCNNWGSDDDCGCDNNRDREVVCNCNNNHHHNHDHGKDRDNSCGCSNNWETSCDNDDSKDRDCGCDKHNGQMRMTPPPIRSNHNS